MLAIALACGRPAARAQAQEPQAEAADAPPGYAEAISEAVEHYSAGRWRRAQEAFSQAHALQPSARTYRGLGLANFYLENFALAREAFEQALADTRKPLPDDQRGQLAELLRACAKETGRFELRVAPPSAQVELDGAAIDHTVLFLDRGAHVIAVRADGHAPEHIVLTVTGGEERALEVTLAAQEQPAPVLLAPDAPTDAPRPSPIDDYSEAEPAKKGGRVLTWVAAAAVPAFAGVAAAVWLTGKGERDDIEDQCEVDRCDYAEAQKRFDDANLDAHATWTNVSLAAAGGALVAAVVLFIVEGDEGGAETGLEVRAGGSGAALTGHF